MMPMTASVRRAVTTAPTVRASLLPSLRLPIAKPGHSIRMSSTNQYKPAVLSRLPNDIFAALHEAKGEKGLSFEQVCVCQLRAHETLVPDIFNATLGFLRLPNQSAAQRCTSPPSFMVKPSLSQPI